jgi:hypothetical protein
MRPHEDEQLEYGSSLRSGSHSSCSSSCSDSSVGYHVSAEGGETAQALSLLVLSSTVNGDELTKVSY